MARDTGVTDGAWVGRPMKRREDRRLLLGRGTFVDDLPGPGALHLVFVRSPHAHARIVRLDAEAARRAPGVVTVVTGDDVSHVGPMPVAPVIPDLRIPPHPIIAAGRVHAAGIPVAAVVAESPPLGRDAAELIEVEYEPLPAVIEPEPALADDAPLLSDTVPGNRAFRRLLRGGDIAAAFASASHRVALRIAQPRISAVALEPRGALARFDAASETLTLWVSCQAPFRIRNEIARLLGLAESRVRVISPDVGGGFGVKTGPYREEVLLAHLALRLGRPVKWVATRAEDMLTTNHGRGSVCEAELALDADGRILGLRARVASPLGAALTNAACAAPWNHARLLPGPYVLPACEIELLGALTTSTAVGPYRGAGRPEACFVIERLMDAASRAIGLDPAEIRRRNLVPADRFPYRTVTGQVYDSGDYPQALSRALRAADYEALRHRQAERRRRDEIVGVGVASYVEPCALGWESGSVRVERSGRVTATTGSNTQGQGHETTFAQVVADQLGLTPDEITITHGDTQSGPEGFGTFGSRSTALGGSALAQAAREVREKGRRIAAALLEAAPVDVQHGPGGFIVAGSPQRRVTWSQVATAAYAGGAALPAGETPGLEAAAYFQATGEVWSSGAVVCGVSIERDTGRLTIESLVWVDDAGTVVNPLLAEGQLHGSLAQAVGQALCERIVYDEDGQLVSGTLMDYAVPRADEVPVPVIEKMSTPSPLNPLGAKGLGEAGCIALPPAIVNAAVDALAPFGVTTLDMPLTPEKLWAAIHTQQFLQGG